MLDYATETLSILADVLPVYSDRFAWLLVLMTRWLLLLANAFYVCCSYDIASLSCRTCYDPTKQMVSSTDRERCQCQSPYVKGAVATDALDGLYNFACVSCGNGTVPYSDGVGCASCVNPIFANECTCAPGQYLYERDHFGNKINRKGHGTAWRISVLFSSLHRNSVLMLLVVAAMFYVTISPLLQPNSARHAQPDRSHTRPTVTNACSVPIRT